MPPSIDRRTVLCLILAGLMIAIAGCNSVLWEVGAASFGLGYLVATLSPTTTVEHICFEDGVQVDCSTLPEFTG